MRRRWLLGSSVILGLSAVLVLHQFGGGVWVAAYQKMSGKRTLNDALRQYRPAAEARLQPYFDAARLAYPPRGIALIGLKEEKRLEVWARGNDEAAWVHIRDYEVVGASGGPGPKLREGDQQVPEGIYRVAGLNPNSSFHLSIKLDYPNAYDRARATEEDRDQPGTDIFIHGRTASIGCLAMGDEAIEELFVLAARTGLDRVHVILAPCDLRRACYVESDTLPSWTPDLYAVIRTALTPFEESKE
jgi:hypothetical protein